MSEWRQRSLGELVTIQKGRKVPIFESQTQGVVPYLGAETISGEEAANFADIRGAVVAEETDILMLWDGERSGLVGSGLRGVVSSTVAKLTPRAELDSRYLFYALQGRFSWIQNQRTGTGVPHVPKGLSRILTVRLPSSIAMQRRIAEILSTVDDAIEQTEALIAKTQQIKAGLMHDFFTRGVTADGRLRPSREEAPQLYKQSSLGWIPKKWEVCTVGQCLSSIDAGHSPDCPDIPARGDQWGVLKVSAISPLGFFEQENKVVLNAILHDPQLLVKTGDLLISRANTVDIVGLVSYVDKTAYNVMLSDKTLRLITIDSEIYRRYLFWHFQIATIRRQIESFATGTSGSMKNISQSNIKALQIKLPPQKEQILTAECIDNYDNFVQELRKNAIKLHFIKSALMHDLLTGRVRVDVPGQTARE